MPPLLLEHPHPFHVVHRHHAGRQSAMIVANQCDMMRMRVDQVANLTDVPFGHQPAVVEQDDVRRERLHFVQHVAGDQHAFSLGAESLDDVHQLAAGDRIGARERLVEKQHFADHGRSAWASLIRCRMPFRVAADRPIFVLGHADGFDRAGGGIAGGGAAQPAQPGRGVHEILPRHPFVKRILLRAEADDPVQRRIVPDILAQNAHRPLAGIKLPGGELKQRRFPRAVGAEQARSRRREFGSTAY